MSNNSTNIHPSAMALIDAIAKGAGPNVRRQLQQLAGTPEARAALDRVDAEAQAHRVNRLRELEGLERKYAADVKRVTAARLAAEGRLAAALAELANAREVCATATCAAAGVSVRISSERARLDADLVNSADPRLAELDRHVMQLQDASRHLVNAVSWIDGRDVFGKPIHRHSSNVDEVTAARNELAAVRADVAELQRQPLAHEEATAQLAELVLRTQAAMASFGLDTIRLNEADGSLVFDAPGRTGVATIEPATAPAQE